MKLVLGIFRKIRRKAWLIKSKFVCWKWMKIYGHDIGKDVIIYAGKTQLMMASMN